MPEFGGQTGDVVLGAMRISTSNGDECTDDTADAVKVISVNATGTSVPSGTTKTVSVTQALAAAGDYAAEDVMCNNATTGIAWTFSAIARANGASGYITKAHALWETTALTPRLTLYLFNTTPTTELDDNKANAAPAYADLAQYIGKIDFPAMEDLGGMSESEVTPSTSGNLPLHFTCATAADDLIGVLVTRDAITGEVATKSMTIRLTVEQL